MITSTSSLPVRTIRFCSVFGVTYVDALLAVAVTHTINGLRICIARDRAWSVSHRDCVQRVALGRPIPAVNRAGRQVQNTNQGAAVIDRKARCSLSIEILAYPTCIRGSRYSRRSIVMTFGIIIRAK